jgi:nucleoside-diphosphate-sugar epimerase
MSPDAHGNLSGQRLVILGCGYVGSELARQAVARGLRVTALTRNPVVAARLSAAGVEMVVAELASDGWHARIPAGAEFVLNCVSSGGGGIEGYRRSYVGGMQSLLAWARTAPVGTLVYTGSTSVYPQGGGVVVDETASTEGAGETARLLLEAEGMLGAGEAAARRRFVLRLAGIYGPGRHHLLDQLRNGAQEIAGRGDHRLNLIHRDDIVGAIWAAFTALPKVTGGIFNVTDDQPATKAEIAGWLAAKIGVPPPSFTGGPGSGRRPVTPDRVISNEKLKAGLGWRPEFPSFREGYARILGAQ